MRLSTGVFVAALVLAGCATVGRKISDSDARSFTVGKTTISDVEAKLGPPSTATTSSDGTQQLIYAYAHSQANAASFIPIAGAFVGGSNTESTSYVYIFDAAGVLTNFSGSQGQSGLNHQ